jgi:hypothetical protein
VSTGLRSGLFLMVLSAAQDLQGREPAQQIRDRIDRP